MDNHLGIFDGDFAGEGSIDYLQFRMERTQYSRQPGKSPIHNLEGYFSLKHALCAMLMTHPELADPDLVERANKTYHHDLRILRADNERLLATHVCVRPDDPQYPGLAPGIYLWTDYPADQLRQMTGIPMPLGGGLSDDHMICLAHYHSDFSAALPTSFYQHMSTYASDFLELTWSFSGEFSHQLTYKGSYLDKDGQVMTGKGSRYVEQHYYDNAHEPLKKLLLTDPFKFDPLCKRKNYVALYDHAYITNPNEDVIATIEVVGFDSSATATRAPGIYFHTMEALGKLQQEAQLDLRFMADYDDNQTTLALAHYQHQQQYSLEVPAALIAFKSDHFTGQPAQAAVPQSPFTTMTTFLFDPFAASAQPFRIASDYYHCGTLELALAKLLGTDFTLFLSSAAQPMGYHVLQAYVTGKEYTPLASLELLRQPPPPGMTEPLPWHIYLQLHQNIALPAPIRSAMAALEGSYVSTQNELRHLCIPVARLSADQVMEPIPHNLRGICALLGRPFPDKTLDGNLRPSQRAAAMPAYPGDSYTLCLDLAKKQAGEGRATEQRLVTVKGLSNAYAMLLLIDPESFKPGNSRYPGSHVAAVRLYEGTIPAVGTGRDSEIWTPPSADRLLVTRYYQSSATADRSPRFCLHFNEAHPKAIDLAMAPLSPLLNAACEQHVLVFADKLSKATAPHNTHPRKIPGPEPDSPAGGPKL